MKFFPLLIIASSFFICSCSDNAIDTKENALSAQDSIKLQNKVYTKSQLPQYQLQAFKNAPVFPVSNPEVAKNIEAIDQSIASYLKYFAKKETVFDKLFNILRNPFRNAVVVKKNSSL